MANGYKLEKGFLVDKKWEKQLRRLKPTQFYKLFWDLYDMQMNGTPAPVYDDPLMDCIADFAAEQIQNRLNGARRGGTPPPNLPPEVGGTPPNTKLNTNTNTNIPPISPLEGEGEGSDERFAQFWEAYPRKEGKEKARKAWRKFKVDDDLLQIILDAIKQQKLSEQWTKDNGRYIPLPATWLNGKRWEDEVKPARCGSFDIDEFWEAALARSYRVLQGEDE